MEDSVIVKNISKAITQDNIQELFSCVGGIVNLEWTSSDNENSCKITFENTNSVKAAELLNGTPLGERPISVTKAPRRRMTPAETIASLNAAARRLNPQDADADASQAKEQELIERTIYVGNVAPQLEEPDVRDFFSSFGNIVYVKMAGNPSLGIKYAFVEFETAVSAQKALTLANTGAVLGDRALKVGPAMNSIVKPASHAANCDPTRIESAMNRVKRAKEMLERRKGRRRESRRRSKERSRDRKRSRRSRSRSRKRSSRHKSTSHRSSGSRKKEDSAANEHYEVYIPRNRPATRPSRAINTVQEGLVWDGFQWTQPSGLSVKQKSENLATKIMDVASSNSEQLNPSAKQAMVQQAHQQAALLREHLTKLGK